MKMINMTAVEWLIQQLVELDKQLDGRRKNDDATVIKLNPTKIYKQALEMEKQQIINAHLTGLLHPLEMEATKQAEQYYNETYKKEKCICKNAELEKDSLVPVYCHNCNAYVQTDL